MIPQSPRWFACLLFLGIVNSALAATAPAEPTPMEHVYMASWLDDDILGTKQYAPSDRERPFWVKGQKAKAVNTSNFDNIARPLEYLGLFGIVREIREDEAANTTTLTIENKYFDGLTDIHLMTVSFNGSGDFQAALSGTGHRIPLLSLVRVYGKAAEAKQSSKDEKQKPLCIKADFVRVWHWETFAFLSDYGTQCGNQKWRELNQVPLAEIYSSVPDDEYYEKRLGKRPDAEQTNKRLLNAAGQVQPEVLKVLERLIVDLNEGADSYQLPYDSYQIIQKTANQLNANEAAIAVLIQAMQEDDNRIRKTAIDWFGTFAKAPNAFLPSLLALLQHRDPRVRAAAAETLAWKVHLDDEQIPTVVEALIRCANDRDSFVKIRIFIAFAQLGPKAKEAVPTLKDALKDEEIFVRLMAADALWLISHNADEVLPVFIDAFKNGGPNDQDIVITRFEEMGSSAIPAIPTLIEVLKNGKDHFIRAEAALALGSIGPKADRAVPELIAAAKKDESDYVRSDAIEALGKIGDEKAIPAVINALDDEDDHVQFEALSALENFGPAAKVAIPLVVQRVKNRKGNVWQSLFTLGAIDKEGISVPVLVKALENQDPTVRRFAAIGIAKIGTNAKAAEEALLTRMEDPDEGVRVEAAKAYWAVSGNVERPVKLLREVLKDPENGLAPYWAAEALVQMGPVAKEAVPELIAALKSETRHVRETSAEALGKIGPDAKDALPGLRLLLEDRCSDVQKTAAEAIRQIEASGK